MESHQLVNQTSGLVEYYTPPKIVEAARRAMGAICLDPASSAKANEIVKAVRFFTAADNGLCRAWSGRVWLNHPFGKSERACESPCRKKACVNRGYHLAEDKPGNAEWISKLVAEYEAGHIEEACCITFASTSEGWFKPLLIRPQCFLVPRTNYLLPSGLPLKGITKGSVVTYFGRRPQRFAAAFEHLGVVKVRWSG